MKNVAFHNLGCKVNSYELDVVQQNFQKKGYKIVPFDQNADIYVINTCTVTNIADRKSRQMLHQAKKRNPDALVVALGCYVQTGQEHVQTDACIDIAIGNNCKKDTVEIVEAYLEENASVTKMDNIIDINHTDEYEEMQLQKAGEHTRAYIKIQDGCNQFCTYCIIPFARGRVRSRRASDICNEIKELAAKGYKEFVLTGIHISSYGVDFENEAIRKDLLQERKTGLDNPASEGEIYDVARYGKRDSLLLELILRIHAIEGVERLRLGSLEPQIVTEDFARVIGSLPKICPHFHLSLQSGCDETLKRMNRHYDTAMYAEGVKRLRTYFDRPAITTDVITGFPGETEEEFEKTKAYLEEISFFEMHIFPYSIRKGTVAATMKPQIDGEVKKERSHRLLKMEKEQSKAYREGFVGEEEEVLFEEAKTIGGALYMVGHTTRYVKVAKKIEAGEEKALEGKMVRGKISKMLTEEILLME